MNPLASSPMKFVTDLTTTIPITTLATSSTTYPITTVTTTPATISAATVSTVRIEPSLHNELTDSLRKKLDSAVNTILEESSDYFQVKEDNNIDVENIDNEDEDTDEESIDHCIMKPTHEYLNEPFKSEVIHVSTSDVDETQDDNLISNEITYDFSKLPWSVVISKQASDFLKNKKISRKVIKDIKRILHEIGQGYRTHAICHRCIQPEDNLFEAYLYKPARIIWQESIQYSEELSAREGREVYTDVVRVLWITTKHTKHQLNDVLQKIKTTLRKSRHNSSNLSSKLVEYKCIQKSTTNLKRPRKFIPADQSPGSKELAECHPLANIFGSEYSLMQFHPFSDFLDALLNNDQSDFDTPICMSPQEHDIICLPYRKEPIILCGRSGTGKTTTCIYRMWNEFKTFWEFKDINDKHSEECVDPELSNSSERNLHQVFITKSPVLCSQVKKHFANLINGNCHLRRMFNKMEVSSQKSIQQFSENSFPLFLTSRQFLLLLDYSLPGKPFFDRDEAGNVIIKLVNSDYNHDINPDVLFEDIEEEREVDVIFQEEWKEVTADFFCFNIWPNMKTKTLFKDPLLVWMEIQSFIKGSFDTLHRSDGHLEEESYVTDLGKKMAPNYLEDDRRNIYQCFLEYSSILLNQSKQYQCHRLFDECDVIHNLFHRLKQQKETEQEIIWYIDNFYVDEVQDFTQAELTLLLMCSKMPNGMFCTGDTAQSIMKGVFFRFEDLKSQFWNLAQSAQQNELVSVPQLRKLTNNFRTHSGILNLAQSVISVMKSTFKKTFRDSVLPSEVAMFEGPKPILLDLFSEKDLALILLGNTEDGSVQSMELGAHQAIIVRNEEKKHSLPDSLKNGIVLTTLEAKGLEFNDVLLYDFFNDSEVS